MKISIITICYNNENDIRSTLESVVNQTYPNIEYIVVDGASKDGTLSIVNEYRERISVLISEPDNGMYEALNKGLKAATGDVVGMIHAGDRLYDNQVVEDIANFFSNNDVDLSYGYSWIVDKDGMVKRVNKSPRYSKRLVRWGWMPSHQSIYVKKEMLEKYGYYTQNVGGSGDYEWFVKYFYKFASELKIKRMDRFVISFSLGGQSTASMKSRVQKKNKDIMRQCWINNGLRPPFMLPYKKFFWTARQFVMACFY